VIGFHVLCGTICSHIVEEGVIPDIPLTDPNSIGGRNSPKNLERICQVVLTVLGPALTNCQEGCFFRSEPGYPGYCCCCFLLGSNNHLLLSLKLHI
jgi:hypothetical protein